jgi:aryl-alcohol dehydrogenase-like predicted oxidoreductase
LEENGQGIFEQMAATVKQLEPVAEKLGVSQSVLALAWVLKNLNVSSAIMGASKNEQVFESVKANETYKKLTPEIMDEIDTILNNKPPIIVERF